MGSEAMKMFHLYLTGFVHDRDGRVTSIARVRGDIPGCIPAPKDPTWLQTQKIREESDIPLYLEALDDFIHGRYYGTFETFSKYWDSVRIRNGIGRSVYPGMA
jgi:hypothetical protein